jgi:excisionase family DNA binding protein
LLASIAQEATMPSKAETKPGTAPQAARRSKSSTAKRAAPEAAPLKPALPKHAYSMDEAAEVIGVSPPTVYDLINEGFLKTFLIGRRRLARPRAIEACMELLEQRGAVLPWQSGGNNGNRNRKQGNLAAS